MNARLLNPTGAHVGKGRRWDDWPTGNATAWMARGKCTRRGTNPNLWFPESMNGPSADSDDIRADQQARRACAGCPVMERCLVYALGNKLEYGVYGGRSARWREKNGQKWLRARREAQA